ncbi:MAG: prepilin-type N-terminal cleavage/methylation domain-containing protein [Gemmatimonadaceae bacterium]|nr:prepilin-type N-terminal cleavage/methylation domain-containing protein [Gemmatimonadaceae bacterium]
MTTNRAFAGQCRARAAAPRTGARRGMTLIEMLMALVIFAIVMAATLNVLNAESRSFRLGTERIAMYQNGRFALNEMEKDLRTAGAGAPDVQPQVVYVSDSVIVVNANYWTNTAGDVEAVYYNPDAPDSAVQALRNTTKITIPYTSVQYPDSNYLLGGVNSAAETIIFYFRADSSTTRSDDYVLYRRVNTLAPEIVSTNILRTPSTPFFRFFKLTTIAGGTQSLDTVPTASLPWRHTQAIHLSINDTGTAARIDSIRAVRVSFRVNNGRTGTEERFRSLSRLIRLPNVGLVNTKTCGDLPLFTDTPVAANDVAADGITPVVNITWNASVDEAAGELDVQRYVIWRRVSSITDWGDPYVTMPGGTATYTFQDGDVASGVSYYYAVSAQDCTPSLSAQRSTNMVTIP